jgi:hypothetical protein
MVHSRSLPLRPAARHVQSQLSRIIKRLEKIAASLKYKIIIGENMKKKKRGEGIIRNLGFLFQSVKQITDLPYWCNKPEYNFFFE